MKILITGGSGFLGTHLIKTFLKANFIVSNFDRVEMDTAEFQKKVRFIKGELTDRFKVRGAFEGQDFIIHNAAILPISRAKKRDFLRINTEGTKNLLESALEAKIKTFLFISSSAVYGIPKETPIKETTPFNPICNYGRSKIEAEHICNEFRKKGLNVIILRPRTIVDEYRVGIFQILFQRIAEGKKVYIIGKGNNPFQLLSAKDLAEASLLCLTKKVINEDFNLGAENFKTLREDLEKLIGYAKSPSKIVSLPAKLTKGIFYLLDTLSLSPFSPWHYLTMDKPFYFDISKAKTILSWQPQDSNLDMLIRSYNWYLSQRKKIDKDFGTTHKKSINRRILKVLDEFF